jgi:hypothetical protein
MTIGKDVSGGQCSLGVSSKRPMRHAAPHTHTV